MTRAGSAVSPTTAGGFPFWTAVSAALLLHLVLVVWAGPGFMNSDDEVYARLANDLVQGNFDLLAEHRANRFGVILPAAAAYALGGVNGWTTVLPSLFWSLVAIVSVALVARRLGGGGAKGDRAGAVAAFLLAPAAVLINSSTALMPDVPVGVQMFVASVCLWCGRGDAGADGPSPARRSAAWGAASALIVAVAVLTKLTALWLAPFFVWFFVTDLWKRRHLRFWAAFALAGLAAGGVFFLAYGLTTGDPLYRMHAVDDRHTATHWGYGDDTAATLLKRITWEPGAILLASLPEIALLLAAALPLARARAPRGVHFWLFQVLTVAAGFWVGSTSLTEYSPLPPLPRMLAPMAPGLAVVAAVAATGGIRFKATELIPSAAVLAFGVLSGLLTGRPLVGAVFVAGAFAIGAFAVDSARVPAGLRPARAALLPGLIAIMCVYGIARGGVGESPAMRAERSVVQRLHELIGEDATLVTDRRSARAFRFHRGLVDDAAGPAIIEWGAGTPEGTALPTPLFAYVHASRVKQRGGRWAPPAWLAAEIEAGEGASRTKWARIVRLPDSR